MTSQGLSWKALDQGKKYPLLLLFEEFVWVEEVGDVLHYKKNHYHSLHQQKQQVL
jgi:hypothetical protein